MAHTIFYVSVFCAIAYVSWKTLILSHRRLLMEKARRTRAILEANEKERMKKKRDDLLKEHNRAELKRLVAKAEEMKR